jgi:hypothetical protein
MIREKSPSPHQPGSHCVAFPDLTEFTSGTNAGDGGPAAPSYASRNFHRKTGSPSGTDLIAPLAADEIPALPPEVIAEYRSSPDRLAEVFGKMQSWNERKLFFPSATEENFMEESAFPDLGICRVSAITSQNIGTRDTRHFLYQLTEPDKLKSFPLLIYRKDAIFSVDAKLLHQFLAAPLESFMKESKVNNPATFATVIRSGGIFASDPVFDKAMIPAEIQLPTREAEPHRVYIDKESPLALQLAPYIEDRVYRPLWLTLQWNKTEAGAAYVEITGLVRAGWYGESEENAPIMPEPIVMRALGIP